MTTTQSGPGKAYRKGHTLAQLFDMFPDDTAEEDWFIGRRWPDGPRCQHCACGNVQDGAKQPTQRYRCPGCCTRFIARTGTVLAAGAPIGDSF